MDHPIWNHSNYSAHLQKSYCPKRSFGHLLLLKLFTNNLREIFFPSEKRKH